ncbi:DNA-methyltransferase [Adonisia turfae]|uniref:Methyltransferase n=1 Tax=Adonisia turfae CCMR0081 TaxID=2292702 RepID=A0A6M0RD43_9CYAN|nr:site-specific DNA-methyltransferase [Adonisia turfae]NEZ54155.1 site-specific DNA-methyltransferase [Adonisia turfae CCMR0081]
MKSKRNQTIQIYKEEREKLLSKIVKVKDINKLNIQDNKTIHGDFLEALVYLPQGFIDLLILDPPYNLTKEFNGWKFSKLKTEQYTSWLDNLVSSLKPLLKPDSSIYVCGDWYSSASIFEVLSSHFIVRNRITWEREKGRGSKLNWKNSSEDIWFCTNSDSYVFNVDSVKLLRKVIAPYHRQDGTPKDWNLTESGGFRETYPSNLWTDITVPFWSMPENTNHPTQKSEKLIAKLILASSNEEDLVFDPFLGSGTTSVVSKKLNRKYLGIEINEEYCLIAEKRLELADLNKSIQGIHNGIFLERNTSRNQIRNIPEQLSPNVKQQSLFDEN